MSQTEESKGDVAMPEETNMRRRVHGERLCFSDFPEGLGPFELMLGRGPVVLSGKGAGHVLRLYECSDEPDADTVVESWRMLRNTSHGCVVSVCLARPLRGPLLANYTYSVDLAKELGPAGEVEESDSAGEVGVNANFVLQVVDMMRVRVHDVTSGKVPASAAEHGLGPVPYWLDVLETYVKAGSGLARSGSPAPDQEQDLPALAAQVEKQAVKLWKSGDYDKKADILRSAARILRESSKRAGSR